MIAKITTGNGFFGAACYDLRIKGNKPKPTDPEKVTILGVEGNINHTIDNDGNIIVDVKQLARDFRFQAMMRPAVRKPVHHWALSWKKGEHLTDKEMLLRAKEFMEAMGYRNTQFIIIRHKKDNEHCHILVNVVDINGERISTEDLIDRAHYAAKMITKIYGYEWGNPAIKATIDNAHNPHEKVRYIIEPIVKKAVSQATNIQELPELLKPKGITCNIKYSKAGKPVGISFGNVYEGHLHSFKGSSLDRTLSAGNIVKQIAANPKKYNNNVHLYGFVNGVRMKAVDSGKTAINLDVCTLESYHDKEGKRQYMRTYHDVVMYTDDKKVVKTYEKLAASCEKNRENKDFKDFKPEIHSVSLDGILVTKKDNSFQVLVGSDKIQCDVKQADRKVHNRAEIVGNIASINVCPDKNFATATVFNQYRPKDAEKNIETLVPIRISGDCKYSQPIFEALKKGELKVGDIIRVSGKLTADSTLEAIQYEFIRKSKAVGEKAAPAPMRIKNPVQTSRQSINSGAAIKTRFRPLSVGHQQGSTEDVNKREKDERDEKKKGMSL